MLGKLLKYEFKAIAGVLLPLYAVLLVLSPLAGDRFDKIPFGSWGGIVQGVVMLLYGCVFGAATVMTVLVLIQRFYKNLLRDEGYLMNTLPVKPWQNVAAKLLCATAWSLVGGVVAVVSVLLLGMDWHTWQAFWGEFHQILAMLCKEYGANVPLFAFEGLLAALVSVAQSIVSIYLALAIGHMANRARIAWSVAAYIAISVVEYVGAMLFVKLDSVIHLFDFVMQNILRNDDLLIAHGLIDGFSLLNLLLGAVMFGLTAKILHSHLNLE